MQQANVMLGATPRSTVCFQGLCHHLTPNTELGLAAVVSSIHT